MIKIITNEELASMSIEEKLDLIMSESKALVNDMKELASLSFSPEEKEETRKMSKEVQDLFKQTIKTLEILDEK